MPVYSDDFIERLIRENEFLKEENNGEYNEKRRNA
jgi:hypothetical protein